MPARAGGVHYRLATVPTHSKYVPNTFLLPREQFTYKCIDAHCYLCGTHCCTLLHLVGHRWLRWMHLTATIPGKVGTTSTYFRTTIASDLVQLSIQLDNCPNVSHPNTLHNVPDHYSITTTALQQHYTKFHMCLICRSANRAPALVAISLDF